MVEEFCEQLKINQSMNQIPIEPISRAKPDCGATAESVFNSNSKIEETVL